MGEGLIVPGAQAAAIRFAIEMKGKGVCVGCGIPIPGTEAEWPRCAECVERYAPRRTELRRDRYQRGLCDHGNVRPCLACQSRWAKATAGRKARLLADGICIACRVAPPVPKRGGRCDACADIGAERKRNARKEKARGGARS